MSFIILGFVYGKFSGLSVGSRNCAPIHEHKESPNIAFSSVSTLLLFHYFENLFRINSKVRLSDHVIVQPHMHVKGSILSFSSCPNISFYPCNVLYFK